MPIIVDPIANTAGGLDLCAVYLNDAAAPEDFAAFRKAGDSIKVTATARGEVRQLVGRRRWVRQGSDAAGVTESFEVSLRSCTPDQVRWLRDHVGVLVCARDHVGTKLFGVYATVPREIDTSVRDRTHVTLTVDQVTFSEAV